MAKYRVRAEVTPGHAGIFRGGRFWSSSAWTVAELTPSQARILEADKRLMVELGEGTKNAAAAKSEALEVARDLEAEKKEHAETKAALDTANAEIDRLKEGIATAKNEAAAAKDEAEHLRDRIRDEAKAKAAAEADAKAKG